MIRRSLRLRLVLLTVLVCGAVLLGSQWLVWSAVRSTIERRYESELVAQAARYGQLIQSITRPPLDSRPPADQPAFEEMKASGALYAMIGRNGQALTQSASWPESIPMAAYLGELTEERDNPPPPPHPRPSDPFPPGGDWQPAPGSGGGIPPQPFGIDHPQSRPLPPPPRPQLAGPKRLRMESIKLSLVPASNPIWRVASLPGPDFVLLFAQPLAPQQAEIREIARSFLLALPIALLLAGLGAAWVASRAVAPVAKLTRATETISSEALHQRIPEGREDAEFARLISTFNAMLDRLQHGFQQARRFSADAAHELNTPLTILLGHLDQGLQNAPRDSEDERRYGMLLEECQRLQEIIEKLLLLSKAETGVLHLDDKAVNLAQIANDVLDDVKAIAPDLHFSLTEPKENLICHGDPGFLRQIVFNLLSNAVKYNRPDGEVGIDLTTTETMGTEEALLRITNTGDPIPAEQADRLFDRFFRVDSVRNRATGGMGLGLSLAREFARAHGGDVTLAQNEPDRIVFALRLPLSKG